MKRAAVSEKQKEVCTCAQKPCVHYPAVGAVAQLANSVNMAGGVGYASPSHSLASITGAIACLRSLAETLPGVLAVANGWAPSGHDFRNRDELLMTVDMLVAYRRYREEKEDEREKERTVRFYNEAVGHGIEQERQRAKEARKGRKRKAAPTKGAK